MNPVAVFVTLLFFGWLWGGWGLLLGAPLIAIFRAIADRLPSMQAVAPLGLGPVVHVIDREADSLDHYRRWQTAGQSFLVRADDVPECRLAEGGIGPRLGWNTWVRSLPYPHDAEEAVFTGEDCVWVNAGPPARIRSSSRSTCSAFLLTQSILLLRQRR